MSKQISLRYPAEAVDPRIEKLMPFLERDNEAMKVTHSKALLLALLEGIATLETRYGVT